MGAKTKWDLYRERAKIIKPIAGFRLYEDIQRSLKAHVRSDAQLLIQEAVLNACLPTIFGEDWEECICERLGILKHHPRVAISAPRREGKSVSVGMILAALMRYVHGFRACVFSSGQRAARSLSSEIFKQLIAYPELKILSSSGETLKVKFGSDIRVVNSFPANPDKVRGQGGSLVLFEEAATISVELFDVVKPLLAVKGTAFVCISSVVGHSNNPFSQLLRNPSMHVIRIRRVCEAHRREGLMSCACPGIARPPPWIDPEASLFVAKLYAGHEQMFERECLGLEAPDTEAAFTAQSIERIVGAATDTQPYNGRIHVVIDPASGGKSDMAVMSLCVNHAGDLVVLHASAARVASVEDQTTLVGNHLETTRQKYPCSTLFCTCEANMGVVVVNEVLRVCARYTPVDVYRSAKTLGFVSTAETRLRGRVNLRALLEAGQLKCDIEAVKAQLKEFRLDETTGKYHGKTGKAGNDDLVMCLLIAVCVIGIRR